MPLYNFNTLGTIQVEFRWFENSVVWIGKGVAEQANLEDGDVLRLELRDLGNYIPIYIPTTATEYCGSLKSWVKSHLLLFSFK
jgi:hypothetical protein